MYNLSSKRICVLREIRKVLSLGVLFKLYDEPSKISRKEKKRNAILLNIVSTLQVKEITNER